MKGANKITNYILLLMLLFPLSSLLYGQSSLLSDRTLLEYLPDNFTGYTTSNNSTFIIPSKYGKLAVRWYNPINMNNTTSSNSQYDYVRLVILNLNTLNNNNSTNTEENQTINSSEGLCEITSDNVTFDNFTGTLFNNNCQEGFLYSIYIPLVASEDYLLAINAEGDNLNDITNLVNAIDLYNLSKESNNF
jgi:hypothetical protein